MILTEEKTYIINVTEVDTDAELGLNKKDIMIKYTNLELLHAVLQARCRTAVCRRATAENGRRSCSHGLRWWRVCSKHAATSW